MFNYLCEKGYKLIFVVRKNLLSITIRKTLYTRKSSKEAI
jgi:hypothetical protein